MRIPGWLFIVAVVALVVATGVCSVGSYVFAKQFAVDLGNRGVRVPTFQEFWSSQPTATPTFTPLPPTATPLPGETAEATADVQALNVPEATVDPLAAYSWNDPRVINILLLGIDQRQGEQGPFHTDTMMVASIDPIRKTVGIISIPRDLYVNIPGYTADRINNANRIGDVNGYPGGGPALAAETVKQVIGVNIDYYVRINFDVFTSVVEAVAPNGVEVCPPEEIDDAGYPDGSYGVLHIYFPAGCQTLQAEQLLQYARTRHGNSDIDRSQRQQEVMLALREEVLTAGGLAQIITQIPSLYTELSDSYTTNLSVQQILELASLATQIPSENIRTGSIGYQQVRDGNVNGQQVLIPNMGAISALVADVFNPPSDMSLAELRERAMAENATIVVYNNTSVTGLASQTRDWLNAQGLNITSQPGNIPQPNNAPTSVRNYTASTWTSRYLAALLGLPQTRIEVGAGDGLTSADVMLVVGPDINDLIAAQSGS